MITQINKKLLNALNAEGIEWDIDRNAVHTNTGAVIYDVSEPNRERYELEDGTIYFSAAKVAADISLID